MAEIPKQLSQLAQIVGSTQGVDEYVIRRTSGRVSVATGGRTSSDQHTDLDQIDVTVHRDLRRGRGTGQFSLPADPLRAAGFLSRQAAVRAARAQGPSWTLPPPSAPARVLVADPIIAEDTDKAATEVIAELTQLAASGPVKKLLGRALVVSAARATAIEQTLTVITSRGFARAFDRTDLSVDATLMLPEAGPGVVETIRRKSRRRDGLNLEDTVTAAAERMRTRAEAKPLSAGHYDVVLMDDALTSHGDALPYGWFTGIVAQTSATLERQGLTRYKPGQSIFGGRKATGDAITVTSDGTLPFGQQSRPFGDASEPVRRWPIVRDGVAAGLSLDLREAALRGTSPNGGVRNLVVTAGPTAIADLRSPTAARPCLVVAELAWLELDARTGRFSAELGLGYVTTSGASTRPVYGGAIRGDVFALLASARLSRETITSGWYVGPRALRVDDVQVV